MRTPNTFVEEVVNSIPEQRSWSDECTFTCDALTFVGPTSSGIIDLAIRTSLMLELITHWRLDKATLSDQRCLELSLLAIKWSPLVMEDSFGARRWSRNSESHTFWVPIYEAKGSTFLGLLDWMDTPTGPPAAWLTNEKGHFNGKGSATPDPLLRRIIALEFFEISLSLKRKLENHRIIVDDGPRIQTIELYKIFPARCRKVYIGQIKRKQSWQKNRVQQSFNQR